GVDMSMNELRKAGERIFNLLRAIDVRNYGRSRRIDESTIDVGFNYPGKDDCKMLDKQKFLKLLEKYYELRGWNKESGWPTREKLEELGLKDVADELERIGRIG
ncbi:MAG TPA: aldehyde ferredoxin oxidoreductase, partial [Candidatus Bathyarchaeota archaeon]|nr:aldehyde ferredoxin oxidoreductase [Candidatus Bathyarchaeota archaeon]